MNDYSFYYKIDILLDIDVVSINMLNYLLDELASRQIMKGV